jgi:uncharacterized protein YbjQ (UPF0145 family)
MLISSLSGNEIFCLSLKGWAPGRIVVGNSVYSLGLLGGLTSGLKAMAGGEIGQITSLISEGRHAALRRLVEEARRDEARGVTGVTSELKTFGGMQEFLAVGSAIHSGAPGSFFTTACSGQDLYCQLDSGYVPRHYVIGNVAYAMGVGRGLTSLLRTIAGGEVREYSAIYNQTRHLALERIEQEAAACGANCVVDIQTSILPFGAGVREMLMVGTASTNPALGSPARPASSELTGEELWNITQLGYAPLRLVLASSVYSIGFGGGLASLFRSFARGEVTAVSRLVYEAREKCLDQIRQEAEAHAADGVIGVKLFINELGGGIVEVLAVGTAIKRNDRVQTASEALPPQAIIRDRDMFFDAVHGPRTRKLDRVQANE